MGRTPTRQYALGEYLVIEIPGTKTDDPEDGTEALDERIARLVESSLMDEADINQFLRGESCNVEERTAESIEPANGRSAGSEGLPAKARAVAPDMTAGENTLTVTDRRRLAQLEGVIEKRIRSVIEVARALKEIRDSRLYRQQYATFEEYCQHRWGFSARRARQLIAAENHVNHPDQKSDGNQGSEKLPNLPVQNERQARELAKVPENRRPAIWQEAVDRTGGKPTAAVLKQIIDEERKVAERGNGARDNESGTTTAEKPSVGSPSTEEPLQSRRSRHAPRCGLGESTNGEPAETTTAGDVDVSPDEIEAAVKFSETVGGCQRAAHVLVTLGAKSGDRKVVKDTLRASVEVAASLLTWAEINEMVSAVELRANGAKVLEV